MLACQPVSLAPDLQMPYIKNFFFFYCSLMAGCIYFMIISMSSSTFSSFCEQLLTVLLHITISCLESFIISAFKT